MGGSVLANMSSLYSHVAWHMHIQSQFRWTQTINRYFSAHRNNFLHTKFSFEIILLKIVSEICQVLCSYTRGVIGISEDWGNFGWKGPPPKGMWTRNPDGRCTFPSLQRSYWPHWASISGTISFTPVQGPHSMASWVFQLWSEATSDIIPNRSYGRLG